MDHLIFTVIIFGISYALIVTEKIPQSVSVIVAAFLLVFFNVINQETAIEFIDFNTIGLLVGMMMLVAIMKKTGIFEFLAVKAIKLSNGNPWRLLILFCLITAVLSALLDNVTTVLIIAPITIALADAARINAAPYLIAEIFSSNIGGTATLIGDPPNIIIGSAVRLSFADFLANNLPIVIVIIIFYLYAIKLIYKSEFGSNKSFPDISMLFNEEKIIENFSKLKRCLFIFTLTIALFVTHSIHGLEAATIALGSSFVLLLVSRHEPDKIFEEIEYSTIFFLVGIFILVGALEEVHAIDYFSNLLIKYTKGNRLFATLGTLWFSGISTAFVNNIPFTTIMIPIIESIKEQANIANNGIWWALSLGSCLGGNGSLAGSAANIVVIALARKNNVNITFWDFFKIAFPLMLGSIALSTIYIYLRYL